MVTIYSHFTHPLSKNNHFLHSSIGNHQRILRNSSTICWWLERDTKIVRTSWEKKIYSRSTPKICFHLQSKALSYTPLEIIYALLDQRSRCLFFILFEFLSSFRPILDNYFGHLLIQRIHIIFHFFTRIPKKSVPFESPTT